MTRCWGVGVADDEGGGETVSTLRPRQLVDELANVERRGFGFLTRDAPRMIQGRGLKLIQGTEIQYS